MKNLYRNLLFSIFVFVVGTTNCMASSAVISNNSGTITKGNSVVVSVTINTDKPMVSIEGNLVCSGAVNNTYSLNFDDSSNALTSKTFSYTLTPAVAGSITCYIVDTRVTHMGISSWETLAADRTVITVNEPPVVSNNTGGNNGSSNTGRPVIQAKPKSSNNFLTSLSVEGLALNSEFDKEKLDYNVTAHADVTKIVINGQLSDSHASVTGLGEKEVKTGDNKFEIVVTAENGSKRTYTINVKVLEVLPTIVNIDKEKYTVIKSKEELPEISEYFEEKVVMIGEDEIPGYYNKKLDYTLVALKDNAGNIDYYIYKNGRYTLYRELTIGGTTLQILDKEVNKDYKKTEFKHNGISVPSYQEVKLDVLKNTYALDNNDIVGNQFYLFYAMNVETGKEGLYQYDAVEKTIQRYNTEILDMYKERSDTYYMYLLLAILVIGVLIFTLAIVLISNKKKRKTIETKNKKEKVSKKSDD